MRSIGSLHGLWLTLLLATLLCLLFCNLQVLAQQDAPCDIDHPCKVGCCSSFGTCGFTDQHCKNGCVSNCNATSECGAHAPKDQFDCAINVCCRYLSLFPPFGSLTALLLIKWTVGLASAVRQTNSVARVASPTPMVKVAALLRMCSLTSHRQTANSWFSSDIYPQAPCCLPCQH